MLTFEPHTLPPTVKAGYLNCKVRPYIPNPCRCVCCQRFGHASESCRGRPICGRCRNPNHPAENCKTTEKCVNCDGPYLAYSRSCPAWKREKEVITLKVKENLSFPEARRRLSFLQKRSFAKVARKTAALPKVSKKMQECL